MILFVHSEDIITTIAGTGAASYSGDEGLATLAGLNQPNVVTVDASGIDTVTQFSTPLISSLNTFR